MRSLILAGALLLAGCAYENSTACTSRSGVQIFVWTTERTWEADRIVAARLMSAIIAECQKLAAEGK